MALLKSRAYYTVSAAFNDQFTSRTDPDYKSTNSIMHCPYTRDPVKLLSGLSQKSGQLH